MLGSYKFLCHSSQTQIYNIRSHVQNQIVVYKDTFIYNFTYFKAVFLPTERNVQENIIQKLSVFEKKILRRIFRPTKKKDGSWKIKTNMELDKLIKHQNIINYIKAQRLSWFGHVHRKPETSIVRKIYKWQPYVTRPVGRPKHRWDDDVRNDLRRMKLLKQSEQAQDRLEWKKIVEKAKTLHELQRLLRRRNRSGC